MKAAEDIFQGRMYSSMIASLQNEDASAAFENSSEPPLYRKAGEPKSQFGLSKGLSIVVDAHYDLLAQGSADNDFGGFTGLIHESGSFPLVRQHGFQIVPGHSNFIALSAVKVEADPDLRSIKPKNRNCLLSDEISQLKIYKEYSQTNCLLECVLIEAQNKLANELNLTSKCTPWYYPFAEDIESICDPWQTMIFNQNLIQTDPEAKCSHCLPDCGKTIYRSSMTSLPFKSCDESNLGISKFCSLDETSLPEPRIWGQQVKDEFSSRSQQQPQFVKLIKSNMRSTTSNPFIFSNSKSKYDSYQKDIAVVHVFFEKPTAFQFTSEPLLTWVQFISQLGGILGLSIGVSLVSFIEIPWFVILLGSRFLKPIKIANVKAPKT
jgi:hypothetical protein